MRRVIVVVLAMVALASCGVDPTGDRPAHSHVTQGCGVRVLRGVGIPQRYHGLFPNRRLR